MHHKNRNKIISFGQIDSNINNSFIVIGSNDNYFNCIATDNQLITRIR